MKRVYLILLLLLSSAAGVALAAPLRELRGAWIVTDNGLDWPRRQFDPEKQQLQLIEILDRLVNANFNTIFIQMQGNGDVLWNSVFQPASADITGDGRRPLPYDVAQFIIDSARARGLAVYAIVNPYALGSAGEAARYDENSIAHFAEALPDLVIESGGKLWLDPGNPSTPESLQPLYTELIKGYDFDGIVIDNLQYPSATFADADTYTTFNHRGQTLEQWRRDNLDDMTIMISDIAAEYRPEMKVMLATDALPDEDTAGKTPEMANASRLLDAEYIDMIIPKLFRRSHYGFRPALESWTGTDRSSRTVLALTPEWVLTSARLKAPDVQKQIEDTRDDENLAGVVVYRASLVTDLEKENVAKLYTDLRNDVFVYPAHMPFFPSRPSTTPYAPESASAVMDEYGRYVINWESPTQDANDTPIEYFTVYLARDGEVDITDPHNEIAHSVRGNEFIYDNPTPGLQFAVTAFDANSGESDPTFTDRNDAQEMYGPAYRFEYYADNVYVSAPKQISTIDIFDTWGNRKKHVATSGNEASIACGELGGGVYVVHTHYADGSADVNKFIK